MANPTEILDQLRNVTPADIEAGIKFCRENIEQIKDRRNGEIETEKQEIAKLRRLARVLGMHTGTARKSKSPKGEGKRVTVADHIADVLATHGPLTTAAIADHLEMDRHAVQCAIGRGGDRFAKDGGKVSLA